MLRVFDPRGRGDRRAFLAAGSLAAGGLFAGVGRSSAYAGGVPASLMSGKSVVFLFQHGGPSQIETFDPKPDAPVENRSATGHIQTAIPGVRFGSTFEKLARVADRLTIVRSFVTGDGNHDIKPVVGKATGGAALGSLYARVAGSNVPRSGLPSNVLLFPRSVDASTGPEINSFGRFDSAGTLGTGVAPFVPGAGSEVQQNLELRLPTDRLGDRRTLLSELDRWRRSLDESPFDPLREQAFETLLGGVGSAFDLTREDPAVVARYDTAPLVRPDQIDKKWNNYEHYVDHAKSLGKLMLLARRLCEAGAGFVTVTTSFVWDMHADVNNATMTEGMRYVGSPFDHAVATFLEDVEQRGLSDKILLVCCGEMGRTPRINAKGGRDHWGNLAPLILSGAGMPRGAVIGQSTRNGGEAATDPVTIPNLVATILQTQFDHGALRLVPGLPAELIRAATQEAIPLSSSRRGTP
ncbi:MAG: DUF1501 domain-containing protein [Planctomycetaceae bacterium]|nr:DUF1501 domain-containing protein [Planctomycetaceae bacterium]